MVGTSKYWQICRLSLASNRGYELREITTAKEFYHQIQMHSSSITEIDFLLTSFRGNSAPAGLCLRCYISYSILKACKRLSVLFSSNYNFSDRDLLPFVLNDDGQREVILADDHKTQVIVDRDGNKQPSQYKLFTVDILASYKSDDSSMSLANWAFLQTKQNNELKQFLAEFGFQHLSNWAMLNRVGVKQLSQLAPDDRQLIEVYHEVYRRDRRQQTSSRGKCPNPNTEQLEEMQGLLRSRNCIFPTTQAILAGLNKVAELLRQYDIWSYRESLEVYEPESGDYIARRDLPTDESNDAIASEENELLDFIRNSLDRALVSAIEQSVTMRLAKLTKSKKYRPFANKFITGLKLYYCEGMSLKEITPILKFGNWDRARRILNPGEFLNSVRSQTMNQLLEIILQKIEDLGLGDISNNPDRLQNLSIQIETFADEAVFQAAAAEIKAGKNRNLKSLYAQQVRLYCQSSNP